jgi:ferrochelatase
MSKTAIILFNLGGPDRAEAVQPFLFNLFHDPAIIGLPQPMRFLLAKLISGKRAPIAREIYAQMGGGSPILPNTEAQAKALEQRFGDSKVFIAMRYWHPFVDETARAVKDYAPDKIILLPLYPQFSTTTTRSSLRSWHRAASTVGLNVPTQTICCYPNESGFIAALATRIRTAYAEAQKYGTPRLLLSAHGLPEKIVKAGDPYPQHCEQTVAALRQALAIDHLDAALCYQSRVGPLKWIGPSTDDEIRRAGAEKKPIVIAPIAFVSEHSETLVEIDIEYRHLAKASGVPFYTYTGTVAEDPVFIDGLAGLVRSALQVPQADRIMSCHAGGPCSSVCPKTA